MSAICSAKLWSNVLRRRPWLACRRIEGDTGGVAVGWALIGVEGPPLMVSVFSQGCVLIGRSHSVGGVLAELVIERRVTDLPRTGEGVWVLHGTLIGEGGVAAGMRKRMARSRSFTDVRLPAGRFDRACGTQQSSRESPSSVFSCRTWSTYNRQELRMIALAITSSLVSLGVDSP